MAFFGKKTELASEKKDEPSVAPVVEPVVEKVDASPSPATASPSSPTPEQQAQLDKVMEQAKAAAQAILGGNLAATLGTPSGNIEDRTAQVQRDFIPGKMRRDKTYIPERVWDAHENVTRRVLIHSDYKYALAPQEDFLTYTGMGYKLAKYDGGSQSGLDHRGFLGTEDTVFTRTVNGLCQRGDCFLMWIPIRGWEDLRDEDRRRIDQETNRAIGSFYNAGYREGLRTFIERDGQSLA